MAFLLLSQASGKSPLLFRAEPTNSAVERLLLRTINPHSGARARDRSSGRSPSMLESSTLAVGGQKQSLQCVTEKLTFSLRKIR